MKTPVATYIARLEMMGENAGYIQQGLARLKAQESD